MRYYFSLQFKRLKRWLAEIGVNPFLGVILILLFFTGLSELLFYKTDLASWIYVFICLYFLLELSVKKRVEVLMNLYSKSDYFRLRMIENILVIVPFVIFLIFKQAFLPILLLPILAITLVFVNPGWQTTRVLPTPFKRFPFEFIIGFRKTILFIVFAAFLIFKAMQVDNYNLGLAGLCLMFLIVISFYFKPELRYFVWIYADKAPSFLKRKILESIMCTTILCTPFLIVLSIFFPDKLITSFVVFLVAFVFIATIVLAKYSAFPREINLPQAILFVLSIWFPPMLLFTIPIFYKMSKKNLKSVLE